VKIIFLRICTRKLEDLDGLPNRGLQGSYSRFSKNLAGQKVIFKPAPTSPQSEVNWRTEDLHLKVSNLTKYWQGWPQLT
jgi:hypothetical protein